jgi:hypothetical protein
LTGQAANASTSTAQTAAQNHKVRFPDNAENAESNFSFIVFFFFDPKECRLK